MRFDRNAKSATSSLLLVLLVLMFLAAGAPATVSAQSPGRSAFDREPPTARAGLEKARNLATSWQPDVELKKITIAAATAEGAATDVEGWAYIFYSKRLRRSYEVSVLGAMTMGAEGDDAKEIAGLERLPKEFVDSGKAVSLAREGGFQARNGIRLTLAKHADEPATWEVTTGNPSYLVDAEEGKFLRIKQ